MATPQVGFTLESFASTVAQALENVIPKDVYWVFAVDDGDDILCIPIPDAEDKASEMVNRLAVGRHFLGLATRTDFAVDWDARSYPAWVATCVEANKPAWFMVKQDRQKRWTVLNPPESPPPWFLLATAGGMRKNLQTGKPITLKNTTDVNLFRTPQQLPHPPTDEKGML